MKASVNHILDFVTKDSPALAILDFNGVLDNQYELKQRLYMDILGDHAALYPELVVYIEREYERNNAVTFEQLFTDFFMLHSVHFDDETLRAFKHAIAQGTHMTAGGITLVQELLQHLPVCIYTSLSDSVVMPLIDDTLRDHVRVFSAREPNESKPSISNLREICKQYQCSPNEVVYIGDGMTADMLPAKLLGMRTVLVSPYADVTVNDVV